jgi:4-hydroxybenzoate polyprenyltransferase
VFAISVAGESLLQRFMSPMKDQLVLGGVQILCSLWVLYDASAKRLPKPQRWALGTLLLWIVIFPWYLERRRYLTRPCPFIEGPVKRTTLAALFILLAVLFYVIFKYAPPR